jgi:hypothetical protein
MEVHERRTVDVSRSAKERAKSAQRAENKRRAENKEQRSLQKRRRVAENWRASLTKAPGGRPRERAGRMAGSFGMLSFGMHGAQIHQTRIIITWRSIVTNAAFERKPAPLKIKGCAAHRSYPQRWCANDILPRHLVKMRFVNDLLGPTRPRAPGPPIVDSAARRPSYGKTSTSERCDPKGQSRPAPPSR